MDSMGHWHGRSIARSACGSIETSPSGRPIARTLGEIPCPICQLAQTIGKNGIDLASFGVMLGDVAQFADDHKAWGVAAACLTGVGCGLAASAAISSDIFKTALNVYSDPSNTGSELAGLGVNVASYGSAWGIGKVLSKVKPGTWGAPFGVSPKGLEVSTQLPGVSVEGILHVLNTTESRR